MKNFEYSEESSAYMHFLGLRHNPFPVAPDDVCFYLSETIEEIVAEIVHGVCSRKGFIILTGEVGLGKTTISRRIISILESKAVTTSLVLHTSLQEIELLRAINHDFGIQSNDPDEGLGGQLQRLNAFLLSQHAQGKNCAIVIDDAQNLNRASLELVRMISNLEVDQQKLVQVLLVGQTELVTSLQAPDLRQLCSRVVIRKIVRSLSRDELRNYIAFKLSAAGDQGRVCVTQPALRKIYRFTGGNFRKVNLLMDRCLYAICTQTGSHRIDRKVVGAAISDLNPEKRPAFRRCLALAASMAVALMVAMGAWISHLDTSRSALAGVSSPAVAYAVPPHVADANVAGRGLSVIANKGSSTQILQRPESVDPAVIAFLGIYQLDRYATQFQQALQEGTLNSLAQRIYSDSGYQLIQLPTMADAIRRRYGALAFALSPGEPPTWLLFWRPRLVLKHYYYNYQGDEICRLQKLFSHIQLYHYSVDGIVGTRLMNAVIIFQKQAGLPVTGFPDAATIFKLCHREEIDSNA